uniref:(northern house mosquito) hypothetical protein n=1 Tax=Culex pipiens TaxID=7175 RepID=A0A8D8K280_CULPI
MLSIILHTVCDLFCSSQFRQNEANIVSIFAVFLHFSTKETGQVTLASIPLEVHIKLKGIFWGHFPPAFSVEFFFCFAAFEARSSTITVLCFCVYFGKIRFSRGCGQFSSCLVELNSVDESVGFWGNHKSSSVHSKTTLHANVN